MSWVLGLSVVTDALLVPVDDGCKVDSIGNFSVFIGGRVVGVLVARGLVVLRGDDFDVWGVPVSTSDREEVVGKRLVDCVKAVEEDGMELGGMDQVGVDGKGRVTGVSVEVSWI
jgi:hypothetical protein